jgi:hypothetical protein
MKLKEKLELSGLTYIWQSQTEINTEKICKIIKGVMIQKDRM